MLLAVWGRTHSHLDSIHWLRTLRAQGIVLDAGDTDRARQAQLLPSTAWDLLQKGGPKAGSSQIINSFPGGISAVNRQWLREWKKRKMRGLVELLRGGGVETKTTRIETGACWACVRPWVWSPAPPPKRLLKHWIMGYGARQRDRSSSRTWCAGEKGWGSKLEENAQQVLTLIIFIIPSPLWLWLSNITQNVQMNLNFR